MFKAFFVFHPLNWHTIHLFLNMDQEEQIRGLLVKSLKNSALLTAYSAFARKKAFKKGEHVREPGTVCRYCYFLISGIARGYYLRDGKEVTTSFCFEGDPVFSLESATRGVPAYETFEILEDAVMEMISFNDLFQLRQQFPEVEKMWLLSVEAYAIWLEERLYSLQFNDAKERYALLIKKYPYIIQRVQLGYIASYLGITKETLSRIRG